MALYNKNSYLAAYVLKQFYMQKDDDLVVFDVFDSAFKANIVKGVLETNGVLCMITNEIFSSVFPLTDSFIGQIRVLVFRKDLELAKKIMASNPVSDTEEQ